ncbi:hypothetical protein HK096_001548 [Nowakowskiella sp. JEL0078]|nr:hypothetical protein HK096_001548 [Nowakowskiella sp. JEL0078]
MRNTELSKPLIGELDPAINESISSMFNLIKTGTSLLDFNSKQKIDDNSDVFNILDIHSNQVLPENIINLSNLVSNDISPLLDLQSAISSISPLSQTLPIGFSPIMGEDFEFYGARVNYWNSANFDLQLESLISIATISTRSFYADADTLLPFNISEANNPLELPKSLSLHLISLYFAYVHPTWNRLLSTNRFFDDYFNTFFNPDSLILDIPPVSPLVFAIYATACHFSMHCDIRNSRAYEGKTGVQEDFNSSMLEFAKCMAANAFNLLKSCPDSIIRIQTCLLLSMYELTDNQALHATDRLEEAIYEFNQILNQTDQVANCRRSSDELKLECKRMLPLLLTFDQNVANFCNSCPLLNESDFIDLISLDCKFFFEDPADESDISTISEALRSDNEIWRDTYIQLNKPSVQVLEINRNPVPSVILSVLIHALIPSIFTGEKHCIHLQNVVPCDCWRTWTIHAIASLSRIYKQNNGWQRTGSDFLHDLSMLSRKLRRLTDQISAFDSCEASLCKENYSDNLLSNISNPKIEMRKLNSQYMTWFENLPSQLKLFNSYLCFTQTAHKLDNIIPINNFAATLSIQYLAEFCKLQTAFTLCSLTEQNPLSLASPNLYNPSAVITHSFAVTLALLLAIHTPCQATCPCTCPACLPDILLHSHISNHDLSPHWRRLIDHSGLARVKPKLSTIVCVCPGNHSHITAAVAQSPIRSPYVLRAMKEYPIKGGKARVAAKPLVEVAVCRAVFEVAMAAGRRGGMSSAEVWAFLGALTYVVIPVCVNVGRVFDVALSWAENLRDVAENIAADLAN